MLNNSSETKVINVDLDCPFTISETPIYLINYFYLEPKEITYHSIAYRTMIKPKHLEIQLNIFIQGHVDPIPLLASIHDNICHITLQVLQKLDLPLFDTSLTLYHHNKSLKSLSTLQQNDILHNCTLHGVITRMKLSETIEDNTKDKSEKSIVQIGINTISTCNNRSCVVYGENVDINWSFGTFHIVELTRAKCQFCPYKSQRLQPNMLCRSISVNNCIYQLKGLEHTHDGIPIPRESRPIKTQHKRELMKEIHQLGWQEMVIIVSRL